MPTPTIFDIERLLTPISDDQPAGPFLKDINPNLFSAAKDARFAAAKAEEKVRELDLSSEEELAALREEDRKRPDVDWRTVFNRCVEILESHSKDLWVAAWLMEAAVRTHGFAGMRDASLLIRGLVKEFWGKIHPRPDADFDEDESYTLSHLASLNGTSGQGTLIAPLETVAIFPEHPQLTFSSHRDLQASRNTDVTEADFAAAVAGCDAEQLQTIRDDLREAVEAYAQLNQALVEICGATFAPPSSLIEKVLEDTSDWITELVGESVTMGDNADEKSGEGAVPSLAVTGGESTAKSMVQASIANRNEAFASILKIAEFFRKTEPNSPLSSMLEYSVKLGRMDAQSLFSELISDQDVLKSLLTRIGIQRPLDVDDE